MAIVSSRKVKGFLIYGIGQAVNLVSPLIIMPYIIAVCGHERLGKIGVGFSIALILCGVVDYGSYITAVKDISVNRDNINYLRERVKAIYLSKFILLIFILALCTLAVTTIPFLAADKPLYFLSLSIVVGQFINPAWFFQATENYKTLSALNIAAKFIYIAAVIIFIKKEMHYIYANLFFGLGAIVANLAGVVFIVRKLKVSLFKNLNLHEANCILKNEFSISASQFFLALYQYFPIVLISHLIGDYYSGQYRIIDQIIAIMKSYITIFFYFIYANLCFELDKDFKSGMKMWRQFNGLNLVLVIVIVGFLFMMADNILAYFPLEKVARQEIIYYFRIAAFIPVLIAISSPLRQLMFALDKNKLYVTITICATILNLVLLYILTKLYGLGGAILGIMIVEAIIIFLYTKVLYKSFIKHNLKS